jgi:hypothetical protein
MRFFVAFLFALVTAIAGLSAQSQLTVDTLLPIGRVLRVYLPSSVPEYEGTPRPWVFVRSRFDDDLTETESYTWRFQTSDDSVRVKENRRPLRVMLDANGDGRRDFYDSLLVLGSDTGWVEDTESRFLKGIAVAAVADVDADGNDDLICREWPGMRVYWGDSVEPMRSYSSILNPEGTYSNQVAPAAICVVNRLQGIPAIATYYDVDFNQGDPLDRWRNYAGWRLKQDDVSNHRDTLQVESNLWRGTFMSHRYAPDPPTLLRNGCWLRLDYNAWVAFDSSGIRSEDYSREVDTLVLSGQQLAGSTMLPLSHPPTLDSMLQLTISRGSILSVRQWLSPEQIIPVETKAYYLQPQTISSTNVELIMPWTDVTGDGIPELGVYRRSNSRPEHVRDYCIEIYDVAGSPANSIMPDIVNLETDLQIVNGHIVWKTISGHDAVVRVFDATGRLLTEKTVETAIISSSGVPIDAAYGRGIRLIELIDSAGHMRRTTMIVR